MVGSKDGSSGISKEMVDVLLSSGLMKRWIDLHVYPVSATHNHFFIIIFLVRAQIVNL